MADKLYGVFYRDGSAPKDEMYKWYQSRVSPRDALRGLEEHCTLPEDYELRVPEGWESDEFLLEVVGK